MRCELDVTDIPVRCNVGGVEFTTPTGWRRETFESGVSYALLVQCEHHCVEYWRVIKWLEFADFVPTPRSVCMVGRSVVRSHEKGSPLLVPVTKQRVVQCTGIAATAPLRAYHQFAEGESAAAGFDQ